MVLRCPNIQAHYNEAVAYLKFGTKLFTLVPTDFPYMSLFRPPGSKPDKLHLTTQHFKQQMNKLSSQHNFQLLSHHGDGYITLWLIIVDYELSFATRLVNLTLNI